jgi:tetratricopeptide (TPR) repeat protein
MTDTAKVAPKTTRWGLWVFVFSIVWWAIAGQWSLARTVTLVSLSLASFMIGSLAGFLFTSYGEEANTLGKVRDWLIGGITAFTFAKAGSISSALHWFADGDKGASAIGMSIAVSTAILYIGIGFLFMFLQRELILNVMLAQSRAERGRLDGTVQAGQVMQRFLVSLPASILSGVDNIEDARFPKAQVDSLREALYAADVTQFLADAEQAGKSCGIDWDIISKAANLHYYRIYFEKDGEKETQAARAYEWIQRALAVNPLHVDFTVKQADVLATLQRYHEAVAIFESLIRKPEAPPYVKKWLGYLYLFVDRLDDAIRYCREYLAAFPDDIDSLFNIACAYAQQYCTEQNSPETAAKSREAALAMLKRALAKEPQYAETVRTKWTQPGESFDCLRDDADLVKLVGGSVSPRSE